MTQILPVYLAASVLVASCHCVSTKVDVFEDDHPASTSSKEDDDVEVKHTIVVSTKLKNNRGGLHSAGDPQPLYLSRGNKHKDRDSGEVPIVKAYKSVETTAIRTPDTRLKTQVPRTFNRNARDEYDFYPNTAFNPLWKPSTYYNNINYMSQDDFYNIARANRPDPRNIVRISDDGAREFYCRKCRELRSGKGCEQKANSWLRESTTQKIKVDGKLAKLN